MKPAFVTVVWRYKTIHCAFSGYVEGFDERHIVVFDPFDYWVLIDVTDIVQIHHHRETV